MALKNTAPAEGKSLLTFAKPLTIGIVTMVVLIGIMGYSAFTFKPDFDKAHLVYLEDPLQKNTELQIRDGEEYTYSFWYNNTQINATFDVFQSRNCTMVQFMNSKDIKAVCLDKYGMDSSGYNSEFNEPMILLFRPWMLALHDGWRWNTSTVMSYNANSAQLIAQTNYRVLRTDTYQNRMAYVVLVNASDSMPQYEWVDAKKRILLRVAGEGFEINLTGGIPTD